MVGVQLAAFNAARQFYRSQVLASKFADLVGVVELARAEWALGQANTKADFTSGGAL